MMEGSANVSARSGFMRNFKGTAPIPVWILAKDFEDDTPR